MRHQDSDRLYVREIVIGHSLIDGGSLYGGTERVDNHSGQGRNLSLERGIINDMSIKE